MMMPSIFNDFDRFFDFPFTAQSNGLMRTDIKDTDAGYEISIELPGMKKENVNAKLDNGYLTISASGSQKKDEKDSEGKYIRRERYSGGCSRSFYVGDAVKQEDIHAKFEDGILRLTVPKQDAQKVEENKYISIEG